MCSQKCERLVASVDDPKSSVLSNQECAQVISSHRCPSRVTRRALEHYCQALEGFWWQIHVCFTGMNVILNVILNFYSDHKQRLEESYREELVHVYASAREGQIAATSRESQRLSGIQLSNLTRLGSPTFKSLTAASALVAKVVFSTIAKATIAKREVHGALRRECNLHRQAKFCGKLIA